jgi:hypothetical protein
VIEFDWLNGLREKFAVPCLVALLFGGLLAGAGPASQHGSRSSSPTWMVTRGPTSSPPPMTVLGELTIKAPTSFAGGETADDVTQTKCGPP